MPDSGAHHSCAACSSPCPLLTCPQLPFRTSGPRNQDLSVRFESSPDDLLQGFVPRQAVSVPGACCHHRCPGGSAPCSSSWPSSFPRVCDVWPFLSIHVVILCPARPPWVSPRTLLFSLSCPISRTLFCTDRGRITGRCPLAVTYSDSAAEGRLSWASAGTVFFFWREKSKSTIWDIL